MLIPCPDLSFVPVGTEAEEAWWGKTCVYSKFRRQGIDIVCGSFVHPNPKANVILTTGLFETFLKYNELIKHLYDRGFSVYTYDHQCQGMSGRWLPEVQDVYIHSFEDYVDDFVYFVTTISKQQQNNSGSGSSSNNSTSARLPVYLVSHSMGGLIASVAMSRDATLISRAVLSAPMLRMKCGLKFLDYKLVLPQPIAYAVTWLCCYLGLGTMRPLGMLLEKPDDVKKLFIESSDRDQMDKWCKLRMRYPELMSTCNTNEWVLQALRAQKKFAVRFQFVQTNTLIISAEHDCFVYNRAMQMFVQKAPNSLLLHVPNSYHETLMENEAIRGGVTKAIVDFFTQKMDSVSNVKPGSPLEQHDPTKPIFSPLETALRLTGFIVGAVGCVVGVSMFLSSGKLPTIRR